MESILDASEPVTPAPSYENVSFWRTEDSGYHTSFTPGSIECSEISNENIDPVVAKWSKITPQSGVNLSVSSRSGRKYKRFKSVHPNRNENYLESPVHHRGVKRPYQEDADSTDFSFTSVPTPTSVIAGGIQKLKVNEALSSPLQFPLHSELKGSEINNFYPFDLYSYTISYPTTPVKKICRSSSLKLSPCGYNESLKSSPLRAINNSCCLPRRSAKKLNFSTHSLSTEIHNVASTKCKPKSKAVRTIFRPEQKVDIIKMLYLKVLCMPAINNIFNYLSSEDIYNFSLVSPTWLQVCEEVTKAKSKKEEYVEFITNTKENFENRNNCKTNGMLIKPELNKKVPGSSLRDINNIVNSRVVKRSPQRSPPTTPKSRRFKTFTKSASLDSRAQLSCVRCRNPAKVTLEVNGEEWVDCTSKTCSYQFCRFCKCDRHPGKDCFSYGLEGPSPSKKKKKTPVVGTKKSKRNLRRLLN